MRALNFLQFLLEVDLKARIELIDDAKHPLLAHLQLIVALMYAGLPVLLAKYVEMCAFLAEGVPKDPHGLDAEASDFLVLRNIVALIADIKRLLRHPLTLLRVACITLRLKTRITLLAVGAAREGLAQCRVLVAQRTVVQGGVEDALHTAGTQVVVGEHWIRL